MKRVTSILCASFVILAMTSSAAFGLFWAAALRLDATGEVGEWTSLALENNGWPHISYYDATNTALKYAWWDLTILNWYRAFIESGNDVGKYSSIALSYSAQVLYVDISWYDETDGDLMHTHFTRDNPPGNFSIVDSGGPTDDDVGQYTSIALDNQNYAHISYYDVDSTNLKYARFTGSGWEITVVDHSGDVGKYSSIAIGYVNGARRIHISYYDDTNDDLKYAYYNGSNWNSWSIDTQGDVGKWTSIAVDSDNHPHISYYDDTNDDLKYAYYDGSSWTREIADASQGENVGQYTSIALDPGTNYPRISYYRLHGDPQDGDLKFAYRDNTRWYSEVADNGNGDDVGQYTSLALNGSGHPRISYYDVTDKDLYYIEGMFTLLSPSPWLEREGSQSARSSSFSQSQPNPFIHRTLISYELLSSAPVSLRIYDLTGTLVKTLINQHQAAGDHSVLWDGRDERGADVPAGIYFYKIESGGSAFSGKTILVR